MGYEERLIPEKHQGALFYLEHLVRYRFAAAYAGGRRVLDIACGTGYGSAMLADAGAASVYAVDVSGEALAYARRHYPRDRVRWIEGDARKLPFPDHHFDLVVCFETIEHVSAPGEVLDELRRVLAIGGILLCSTPNADLSSGGNPFHLHEMPPAVFERELRSRFGHVLLAVQVDLGASAVGPAGGTGVASGDVALPRDTAIAPYLVALGSDRELPQPTLMLATGPITEYDEIERLRQHVQRLEGGVAERDTEITRRDAAITRREAALADLDAEITYLRARLRRFERSRSFALVRFSWALQDRWRRIREKLRSLRRAPQRPVVELFPATPRERNPLVSVVVPVYENAQFLAGTIASVLAQSYRKLELVLWDDASPDPRVPEILSDFARRDPRVKHFRGERNLGISGATNEAVVRSSGTWIAFLDCDDKLPPHALERVVNQIRKHPEVGFFYTNRTDVDEQDALVRDWEFVNRSLADPKEELLQGMFASHLKVASRETIARAGPLRAKYDLAQDYDQVLRYSEVTRFGFIREPLYRHRVHGRQSTHLQLSRQQERANQAKRAALLRRNLGLGAWNGKVSIVVLSLNRMEDTRRCIEALDRHTSIPFELVVLDNGSTASVCDWLRRSVMARPRTKVIFSDVNLGCAGGRHEALRHAEGEFIVTLDNDIEVTPGWLQHLLFRVLDEPQAAGACCRAVFPNGKVQFTGGSAHIDDGFIKFSLDGSGMPVSDLAALAEKECDWIPGGATVFRRAVYESVHYATGLKGSFEDNHFSLAVRRAGWKLLNAPLATVWHHHVLFNERAACDVHYMRARYNRARLWNSVVEFYRLNQLVIDDPELYAYLGTPYQERAELKNLVVEEAARAV